jgi:hypothetical protein
LVSSFEGIAMPKYRREKGEPIDLPVYGDAEHNMGIYQAIGVLVINWDSDERAFPAMLQAWLAAINFRPSSRGALSTILQTASN